MNSQELRKKSDKELAEEILELRREQYNLRMQVATGQLENTANFAKVRRDIARCKTLLTERKQSK